MQVKEYEKIGEGKVMIIGFPGTGMAGAISAEYIVHKLNFKEVGYIRSDKLPSVVIIRKSRPESPIRIYEQGNLVVIVSDIMIPDVICHEFARELCEWITSKKPKEVVILGGVEKRGERKNYIISWKTKYLDEVEDLEPMKLGFVVGIYGPLVMELMEKNIPGYLALAGAEPTPDPQAAAFLVKHLAKRYGFKIDTKPLEKEAMEKKVKAPTWDPYPSIYG